VEGSSGQQPFTFTVSRTGATNLAASVTYAFTATLPETVGDSYPSLATASDFSAGTPFTTTLNFAPNELSQTITLNVLGDGVFEQDEYFDIRLSSPSVNWTLADSRATGIIRSDESVVGVPKYGSSAAVNEGPFDGALIRWRQVAAANGAFDEWGLDNVSLANSTFADDFDPGIDNMQWSVISNGTPNSNFVGSSGNALFMSGGPDRRAVSRILHAQPGDMLTFDLIFGDSTNGGENADPGEDVLLEYSVDGGSTWLLINTYDTEDYTSWTTITASLPTGIDTNPPSSLRFSVARDGGAALPVTVNWAVDVAGLTNPVNGQDFLGGVLPSGQLTLQSEEAVGEIVLAVQGDFDFEPNESLRLTLTGVSGTGTVSLDGALTTGQGQILNDDASYTVNPGPQFRWRQIAHSNGAFDQWAIDNVSLTGGLFADDFDPALDPSQWSDIQSGVVNTNFGGTGNSLFFTGNQTNRWAVSRRVVAFAGDVLSFGLIYGNDVNGGENPEPGEEVVLEYSLNDGASWTPLATYPLSITTWTTQLVPVPPAATQQPTALPEGNAGSTVFSFQVQRSGNTNGQSLVNWSVTGIGTNPANAADFAGGVLPGGTLNFQPGETTKTVEVQVRGDAVQEPNEMFEFRLASSGGIPAATATILNDDTSAPGDFNGDGMFDCADIDDLVGNIAQQSGNLDYDLSGDGQLTLADVDQWLLLASEANLPPGSSYDYGDANLDALVDNADFSIWFANAFTANAGWCGGDFNADGFTDGSDFSLWNNNRTPVIDVVRNADDANQVIIKLRRSVHMAAKISSGDMTFRDGAQGTATGGLGNLAKTVIRDPRWPAVQSGPLPWSPVGHNDTRQINRRHDPSAKRSNDETDLVWSSYGVLWQ
jgi:hypothetical protein